MDRPSCPRPNHGRRRVLEHAFAAGQTLDGGENRRRLHAVIGINDHEGGDDPHLGLFGQECFREDEHRGWILEIGRCGDDADESRLEAGTLQGGVGTELVAIGLRLAERVELEALTDLAAEHDEACDVDRELVGTSGSVKRPCTSRPPSLRSSPANGLRSISAPSWNGKADEREGLHRSDPGQLPNRVGKWFTGRLHHDELRVAAVGCGVSVRGARRAPGARGQRQNDAGHHADEHGNDQRSSPSGSHPSGEAKPNRPHTAGESDRRCRRNGASRPHIVVVPPSRRRTGLGRLRQSTPSRCLRRSCSRAR